MAESRNWLDNYNNCPDLLDFLRENRKVRLGIPQSGEYIIIEYNLTDEHLQPPTPIDGQSQRHPSNSLDEPAQPPNLPNPQLPSPIDDDVHSQAISLEQSQSVTQNSLDEPHQLRNLSNEYYNSESKKYPVNEPSILELISIHFNTLKEIINFLLPRLNIPDKDYNEIIDPRVEPRVDEIIENLIFYYKKQKRLKELVNVIEQVTGDSMDKNDERIKNHYGQIASPKVFISYSHDSDDHREFVLQFTERLWNDGIDCEIDQFYEDNPPDDGWPTWTENQVLNADFVLMVFTEQYRRRYDAKEPGKGRGVAWETRIVDAMIYDQFTKNTKFIPVVFIEEDLQHIPYKLKRTSHYIVKREDAYEQLLRRLTGQSRVIKPTRGKIPQLESRKPSPLKFSID